MELEIANNVFREILYFCFHLAVFLLVPYFIAVLLSHFLRQVQRLTLLTL